VVHGWVKVLHFKTLALAKGICNQSATYQLSTLSPPPPPRGLRMDARHSSTH
jgi:hypothetical protein